MTRARTLAMLIALAAIFATAGIWLAFDNPTIGPTSGSDNHECLVPYDTVLLGADDMRGGPYPDQVDIAATCRAAGERRFALSAASGSMALIAIGGFFVVRRKSPAASTTTQKGWDDRLDVAH